MLPQNCGKIHLVYLSKFSNVYEKSNGELYYLKLKENVNTLDICCFDYLINLEEYYSENLIENIFYQNFIKLVYIYNEQKKFDYIRYNKESLMHFIEILNKVCCHYFMENKIKYSKFFEIFEKIIIN